MSNYTHRHITIQLRGKYIVFERNQWSVSSTPPAAVRAAVGREKGSINDVLHRASWPVQRCSESPVFLSIINDRPYYYYLRNSDDRCVVRAHHACYRTEQWYLRQIVMKIPIKPFHAVDNPDPLRTLRTVTNNGTSTVHTTHQETARALRIIRDDNEGELALIEASLYSTLEALMSLFTQVTIKGQPALRVLCGLGLSLTTPNDARAKRRPRQPGDVDDRSNPFDLEADSDDGDDMDDDELDHDDNDADNDGTDLASSAQHDGDGNMPDNDDNNADANQRWQLDSGRNPDLQRVRNLLLGRYRGSQPERVNLFLVDLKESFEANGACPTMYGIPLPPHCGHDPVSKEIARWKHDPALETFN